MKYHITLFLLIVFSALHAQDIILLRSGDEVQGTIVLVNENEVEYLSKGNKGRLNKNLLYLIKYEKRGNVFFTSSGEMLYNSEDENFKQGKNNVAIYLCGGKEIMASEIQVTSTMVNYKPASKNSAISSFFSKKKNSQWASLPKEDVFLIRYYDGTREVVTNLSRKEEDERISALPKVKHPFIPINKDPQYPCAAEMLLDNGLSSVIVIYDVDREYIHYRKKEWLDGPIFRIKRSLVKDITINKK